MMMMMMMYGLLVCMFLCVDRYKYVCVHYQFLLPYWLQHIMINRCSSTIRCIFIIWIIIFHHTHHHHHHHTPYYSVCHYLHIIISHLISHYYPFLPSHLFLCVLFLIVRWNASSYSMWEGTWEYRTGTVTEWGKA